MCLAGQKFPSMISIDICDDWDPRRDTTVDIFIEDAHREQAADEILDDDRLQYDVIEYCSQDSDTATIANRDWYTNDNFLTICKLLRDNDEAFKTWWAQKNAERIHNRAVDIACEQAERDYRGKR